MQVLKKSQINQLFHPTGEFGQETQEIVYSLDTVSISKFTPILLKEYFYLVKKGGYLVIDYKPSKFCNFQKLEEMLWWLWKGKYDILYHGSIDPSEFNNVTEDKLREFIKKLSVQETLSKTSDGYLRFVCKKLVSTKIPGDDINKWSFGMITKGERNDWIEEIIASIRAQKIPHYEVIICGTYYDRKEKDIKYIPFRQRDDKAWITKKKNVVAKAAKYENLCIIHDRIVFDKDWFKGMKKYGNCFELLCNKQTLKKKGIRTGDWLTYGYGTLNSPFGISQLKNNDWDNYVYMGGQLSILKKSIWEKCPWNETLYWGEEDVELSFRFRDFGFLIRFNDYSSCSALTWRFGTIPTKYYFSEGLLPKDMLVRRLLRFLNKLLFSIPFGQKIFAPLIRNFMQLKIYKYVIHN